MHTFTKRLLVLGACGVAGLCTISGLTSTAKYKPYGVPDLLRDKWEAKQAAIRAVNRPKDANGSPAVGLERKALPAAVVDEAEFDFGMLDAGTSAKHSFVIRNEGDAPLAITAADTSCKCTLSETSAESIEPGSTAAVTLTWNTGSARQFYRQYAIIRTNDPNHPEIELAVRGQIRTQLGFSTEELAAPGVNPGERVEAETILFSQSLAEFEVAHVECGLPGFQYHIEPVSDEQLRSLSARSAWRLRVSTDGSLEAGPLTDAVRVSVRSKHLSQEKSPLLREIMFRGNVLSPITFHGPQLYRERGLDLGITHAGTERVAHVIVRVRGADLPSTMEVSAVEPEILKTEIEPIPSRPGVFRLTITVPAEAPQVIFNTEQKHGFVEVCDPSDPEMRKRFPVHGAVLSL